MPEHLEPDPAQTFAPASAAGPPGFVRMLWRRKLLVALPVVIGVVVAVLAYVQSAVVYQSSCQVLVVKKRPDSLPLPGGESRAGGVEDYLATHLIIIASPSIISRAVEKGNLSALATFAGDSNPTAKIIAGLKVTREVSSGSTSNILNLSFRGPVEKDCAIVLSAVVESYKEFLDTTYRNVSDDTVKLINKAAEVLETKLTRLEGEFRKFRLEHPMLWRGKDGVNILQDRMFTIEAKRSALLVREAEAKERLSNFQKAIKDGRSRKDLLAMIGDAEMRLPGAGDKTGSPPEDLLAPLELEEQVLLEDYGVDHPKVKAIRQRIAFLRQRKVADAGGEDGLRPRDPVQAHLDSLQRDLDAAQSSAEALAKLFQHEQAQAMESVNAGIQEDAYRTDIGRHQQLFDSVVKRLQEMSLLKDFGGFDAQSISPPGAGWKVSPRILPFLAPALFLGLLAGLGLVYLAEMNDQSFHSADEVRRRLGVKVLGQIPYYSPEEGEGSAVATAGNAPVDPALCTFHRSRSLAAEAFRGVRTALFFSAAGKEHQVVQITSPEMGDGKSILAANLAISIAQSQKTVLLMDADLRRPRLHKLFGISFSLGLTDVLAGDVELSAATYPTGVPGLSLMPCGKAPQNPAELLTLPRFRELLDHVRDRYDFIIVDTSPLLAVTDPSIVTRYVDGVLLIIRLSKHVKPRAARAKEILTALGATLLGVVVNGADRHATMGYAYDGYGSGTGADGYYRAQSGEEMDLNVAAGASPPGKPPRGRTDGPQ
jgi:polysaccharide biosynthesis transport protein